MQQNLESPGVTVLSCVPPKSLSYHGVMLPQLLMEILVFPDFDGKN